MRIFNKNSIMKIQYLFIILLLYSCNSKPNQEQAKTVLNSDFLQSDTTIINGISFVANYDSQQVLRISSSENGLILESNERQIINGGLSFMDINGDEFEDIYLKYNTEGANNLLLFDANANNYKYIDGIFKHFPNLVHIQNTPYYFSFQNVDCSGKNWESFLFTIQGFEAFELAYMTENGCDNQTKGIFIYDNPDESSQILLDKLPTSNSPHQEIIKKYWTNNWQNFTFKSGT